MYEYLKASMSCRQKKNEQFIIRKKCISYKFNLLNISVENSCNVNINHKIITHNIYT